MQARKHFLSVVRSSVKPRFELVEDLSGSRGTDPVAADVRRLEGEQGSIGVGQATVRPSSQGAVVGSLGILEIVNLRLRTRDGTKLNDHG
jgi:hypothetical protein